MWWVYVLGIWNEGTKEMRFRHAQLQAENESKAYLRGGRIAKERGWLPVKAGESANDIVVAI